MKARLSVAALSCLLPSASAYALGFLAGAARVDITPDEPVRLSGYGARTSVSEGVDSRIFARALVLKDEAGVLTVLVAADAIGIPARVRDRVVGDIRGRTGIYHVRFALAATHSHYAPVLTGSIRNIFEMTPGEEQAAKRYTDAFVEKVVKAIDEALGKLAPAAVLYGKGSAGFARNRRPQGGPVEHDLPVLFVRGEDGKDIAVVFSYACHATTIPADINRVCGDWPGYAAELIEANHPGAVALPLIGCGADANPDPRGELAHARKHGGEIAAAVEKAAAGELRRLPALIDAQFETVPLRFASIPSEAELRSRLESGPEHVRRHARLQLDRIAREGKLSATYPYPIQVWSFGGDLVLVLLAGEVVVDYAIRLRAELAGKDLWISSYVNDIPAYIPSRRILAEGGYEADDSMIWYGQPSRWDASVEEAIVDRVKVLAASGPVAAAARIKPPPPRSPREAVETFRLPAGLRIELAAGEPEVTSPVQIAFDEGGRLYAAEMRDYPLGPGEGKPFDGRVRVLEDADLDGYYERSSVLAENVPFAIGIACSRGGVFAIASTEILYLKDTDGDGKADERRVVYSGFKPGNSQHLANSLEHGLDNWIYVNGGDAATVHCAAKEGIADLLLVHASFRFHPLDLRTEATTGYRGGFGIAFDDRGSRFVCDNQTHGAHVVFERPDLSRNPDLRVDETMAVLTDHGATVYPASKPLERLNDPQDYGRFSSACGVHVYGGDNLPPEFRGCLLVCEPVSNLVHRDLLEPAGATYRARRGEKESELLASTDHWFRPVSCTTGPDGALYIADMYREVIEHPEWIPAHMQKLLDLKGGMDRGRIWRVAGAPIRRRRLELARANAPELAASLSHPNAWVRGTAQRLLVERAERASPRAVSEVLARGQGALGRLHALWTLEGLGALEDEQVRTALGDSSAVVRAHAVQLARTRGSLHDLIAALAGDDDLRVRFRVALAVGELDASDRTGPLARIAARDAADPWVRTAILTSSPDLVALAKALVDAGLEQGGRTELFHRVLSLIGTRKRPPEVIEALALITMTADDPARNDAAWRIRALSALLAHLEPGEIERLIGSSPDGAGGRSPLAEKLEAIYAGAAGRARDESATLARRIESLELLGRAGSPSGARILSAFLEPLYPADLQTAAVRALARTSRPDVAGILIGAFGKLTPAVRSEVLDALLEHPARARALLAALESGAVEPLDLDLPRRRRLLESPDQGVRARAEKVLAQVAVNPDRAAVVERYRAALASPDLAGAADPAHGEALFVKNCSACHRLGDRGTAVGADLAGMRARPAESLITDILDPSRAVAPEFLAYACVTRDGRVLTGLLASETPSSIVLRREDGKKESILRRDIQELKSTGKSVMPEGLEQQLEAKGVRDVIAYIRSGFEAAGGGVNGGVPVPGAGDGGKSATARLKAALTFHASFDDAAGADFARGDARVYTGKELGKEPGPGLTTGNVQVAKGKGRFGGALEFRKKDPVFVFFRGEKNIAYAKSDWSGTASFWLSLDPDRDLEPGYCDPIQITERGWNDGALFVDFTKDDAPRHFRLGVFSDRKVWDPRERDWEAIPAAERPMAEVAKPPFGRGKWTHVAFTWTGFNTGKESGAAKLYLDGELRGSLTGRREVFTWEPAKAVIQIGMYYVGLYDDLALFDRALTGAEVKELYGLDGGVKKL